MTLEISLCTRWKESMKALADCSKEVFMSAGKTTKRGESSKRIRSARWNANGPQHYRRKERSRNPTVGEPRGRWRIVHWAWPMVPFGKCPKPNGQYGQ